MEKLILALTLCAACGGWTKRDTLREVAFAGATVADWHQTQDITRACDEQNPIMGACGERVGVNLYMPTAIIAHALISAVLPRRYREPWQYVSLGAEGLQVWQNYRNGWGWNPPPPETSSTSSVLVTKPLQGPVAHP